MLDLLEHGHVVEGGKYIWLAIWSRWGRNTENESMVIYTWRFEVVSFTILNDICTIISGF